MGSKGRLVAENFSKNIWEERWTEVLQKQFPKDDHNFENSEIDI